MSVTYVSKDWNPYPNITTPVNAAAMDDLEVRIAAGFAGVGTSGKGYVNHGAVAGTARPTGYASIEWHGSVTPTNAVNGDTWVDTT